MRRRLKSVTGYRVTTSPKDAARTNRRSENPSDTRNPKRVRTVDGVHVHDSTGRHVTTESPPRSDAPKTSEFAYFRKVKSGAIRSHSRRFHKEKEKLRSSKLNNLITETGVTFGTPKPSKKDLKISVLGERAWPYDHNHFLSPSRVSKLDEQDPIKLTDNSENGTPIGRRSFSSPPYEALEDSDSGDFPCPENEYSEIGIFSEKRNRLRQWAAHTLFPEEKPCLNGIDIVSALMSRLFPKNNDYNDSPEDADISNKSLTLHESDNHLSRKRDLYRSSENLLPEYGTIISRFPFHDYGTENQVESLLDQYPKSYKYTISDTQNDSSICLPFERHISADSFRFKGLDGFSSITDRPREEILRPLLEWEFEWSKDKMDSSIFYHDSKNNPYAGFPPSWNIDEQRFTDKMVLNAGGSCPSFSNYFLEFDSMPNTRGDFGPSSDDVSGRFSLALPSTTKCITLGEDQNQENLPCEQNNIFSYRDQQWLKDYVWDGKPESDCWEKCLSAPDFSAAEYYPSIFHASQFHHNEESLCSLPGENFDPSSEGASYRHFLSSNFRPSLDALMNRPLLLDHVSRNKYHREIYFDDDDDDDANELKYI
ncbi:hypothetical protein OROGR_027469 [Orobanche gracilis]